jgi:hypothetical protein
MDTVRCAVHAALARFGSLLGATSEGSELRGSTVRLTSDASSRHGAHPRWGSHRAPRSLSPPPRDGRRFGRPEAPSTDKRALTNSRSRHRPCDRGFVPDAPSPENTRRASGSTVRTRSAATEHACIDRSATCQNLQAARSTSTTRERPNLARDHAFSAWTRHSSQGAASRRAPGKPSWRLGGACLAGRRSDPVSMRTLAPRPTGARRALTRRYPGSCRRR